MPRRKSWSSWPPPGRSPSVWRFPIALAIVVLLAIVTISYEQTIHAYPGGGGAYIVARDNLGELPAQTAGAALLTDYILTVAVSISSGVAQIVSAFPAIGPYRVTLAVSLVLLVMVVNLRGVKESGRAFAIPTYFFLALMMLTVGIGLVRYFTGTLGTVVDPPLMHVGGTLTVVAPFLLLHAFANGTTALTGRRGHLQRHHRLQGAAQPQRRHHPDLDVGHPGHALPRHHLPGGPDRTPFRRRTRR